MKQKLCYVMPSYDPAAATHFAYLEEFVRRLTQVFDVFLIVERGAAPSLSLGCARIRIAASRFSFIRLLKEETFLWEARLWGARRFYVHYSFYAAYVASVIARATGGRAFYWNCGEPWKYRQRFVRRMFERFVYRFIHVLVTGTAGLADEYAARYGLPREKIKVMGNWITLGTGHWTLDAGTRERLRKELRVPEHYKTVLFVHRLSRRKGAHLLPDIILAFRGQPVTFLIAGEGPEREAIERQVTLRHRSGQASDKGQGNVRLLGAVPHAELEKFYALADCFFMPSEEEGFPHVLLEAMAAGVPFVASDVGGVREIVPPSMRPYLVPAGDAAACAERLRALCALSSEEHAALANACMTWVERYDITKALAQFSEIVR